MSEMLAVIIIFIVVMIAQYVYMRIWENQERNRYIEQVTRIETAHAEERQAWREERQQLLDRIQAPTFSEYKHQEVKVIKAKSGVADVVIETL